MAPDHTAHLAQASELHFNRTYTGLIEYLNCGKSMHLSYVYTFHTNHYVLCLHLRCLCHGWFSLCTKLNESVWNK